MVDITRAQIEISTPKMDGGKTPRKPGSREPFDIESLIDVINREGIADLWLNELRLRFKHELGRFDLIFRNAPLTEGSEAHKWVANYMRDLIRTGWITRAQLRHLPLITTKSRPPGESLALEEISSPEFIRWLSEETYGLMRLKLIQRKDATTRARATITP